MYYRSKKSRIYLEANQFKIFSYLLLPYLCQKERVRYRTTSENNSIVLLFVGFSLLTLNAEKISKGLNKAFDFHFFFDKNKCVILECKQRRS